MLVGAIFINAVFINNCTNKLQCLIIMELQWNELLKKCNHSEESIKSVAEKFLQVDTNERLAVAKVIEIFMDYQLYGLQNKMNVLEIITELLMNDPKKSYVLHLPSRILTFIKRYKHLIHQDPQALQKLKKIMQKWRSKKVFTEQYMTKFQDSAGMALLAALLDQKESGTHFVRYSKTMVMNISDVRKQKVTALLYELKCRADKISKQTASLNIEQQQIRGSQSQTMQPQHGKQLLKIADKLIEQHIQMLLDLQQSSQQLFSFFQSESQAIQAHPTPNS